MIRTKPKKIEANTKNNLGGNTFSLQQIAAMDA